MVGSAVENLVENGDCKKPDGESDQKTQRKRSCENDGKRHKNAQGFAGEKAEKNSPWTPESISQGHKKDIDCQTSRVAVVVAHFKNN